MSWLEMGLWFVVWLGPTLLVCFLASVVMQSIFNDYEWEGFGVTFFWIACFSLAVAMNQ